MEWFFNRQTQSQWNAAGFGFLTARCRSGTDANGPWSGFLTARVYAICNCNVSKNRISISRNFLPKDIEK